MTQVTEAELRVQMEQLFVQIDVNKNGKLEHDEVKQFSLNLHEQNNPGQPFDEDAFDDHFDHLDRNDDLSVSKIELFNSMVEKARESGKLC